jgi:hypothetical protein
VALEHQGVQIRYDLVTTLNCVSDERSDLGVHPGLDNTADRVVIFISLEAVDGKPWRINAMLDPAEQKFWTWLWTFEATNVMTVALAR